MNTSKLDAPWRLGSGIGSLFLLYFWFGITVSQGSMDKMAIHLGSEVVFGFITLIMLMLVPGVCLAVLALSPERSMKLCAVEYASHDGRDARSDQHKTVVA
jgi:hypothetical protein